MLNKITELFWEMSFSGASFEFRMKLSNPFHEVQGNIFPYEPTEYENPQNCFLKTIPSAIPFSESVVFCARLSNMGYWQDTN